MSDISIIVAGDDGRVLYSGKDQKKMDEAMTQLKKEEDGYLFVREENYLSLSRLGNQTASIHILDERVIQLIKELLQG
jgi:hypothetical protein